MRYLLKVLCLLACLLSVVTAASASPAQALTDALGLEDLGGAVPEQARELLPEVSAVAPGELTDGISAVFETGLKQADGYLSGALRTAGLVAAISLLCGLVSLVDQGKAQRAIHAAGVLAITAACAGSLNQLVGLGVETVRDIQTFSNALLPTMAAAVVANGAPAASSALYVATVFFSNVTVLLFTGVFVPLVWAYVFTSAADAAIGSDILGRVGGLCKWIVSTGLKTVLTVYLGWMTVTGILSGSADAATVKAAKLALSTAVPVVGSIISDASETVLVSAGLLKNGVGVFGMLAVLAICILPFLRLGIHYLVFKGAAAVSGCFGTGNLNKLVDALSSAMGMLLAMTGVGALTLIISLVCSMKAVTP